MLTVKRLSVANIPTVRHTQILIFYDFCTDLLQHSCGVFFQSKSFCYHDSNWMANMQFTVRDSWTRVGAKVTNKGLFQPWLLLGLLWDANYGRHSFLDFTRIRMFIRHGPQSSCSLAEHSVERVSCEQSDVSMRRKSKYEA